MAHRRANCIRKLFIQDELVIGSLPAVVMAAVLGSQCSSLEGLYLHAADVSLAGQDIAALAVLTRLTMLQVHDTCFNPNRLHEFPIVCIPYPSSADSNISPTHASVLLRQPSCKIYHVAMDLMQVRLRHLKYMVLPGAVAKPFMLAVACMGLSSVLQQKSVPSHHRIRYVTYFDLIAQGILFRPQVSMSTVLFEDRGATLIWAVQQLPALTCLDIHHDSTAQDVLAPISDDNGLPHCQQLAALHSNSLTQLRVCMLGVPLSGNTLRLVELPKLQSLVLVGESELPLSMQSDAASFQGAPMLRELWLAYDEGLELQPGSLKQLSALTALTITGCGLRTVPEDVALLSATLRRLDLSSNDRLQLDDRGLASILRCSHLDCLHLYKSDLEYWRYDLQDVWHRVQEQISREGYTPVQFSSESLRNLMKLPYAFHRCHGRELRNIL